MATLYPLLRAEIAEALVNRNRGELAEQLDTLNDDEIAEAEALMVNSIEETLDARLADVIERT